VETIRFSGAKWFTLVFYWYQVPGTRYGHFPRFMPERRKGSEAPLENVVQGKRVPVVMKKVNILYGMALVEKEGVSIDQSELEVRIPK
jgi:hypothetical protein